MFCDASLEGHEPWAAGNHLREFALGIQELLNRTGERNALVDEFLDLCESPAGEPRLAREFLRRIERGKVGTPT